MDSQDHLRTSGRSGVSLTCCTRSQRERNSLIVSGSMPGSTCDTQAPSCMALLTVVFNLHHFDTLLATRGANSEILIPCSHLSSQNKLVDPSPTTVVAAPLKSAIASFGAEISNSLHSREVSDQLSHGHLACIAVFSQHKLGIPSPLAHFGEQTVSQATFASILAHHKKLLIIITSKLYQSNRNFYSLAFII